MGFIVDSYRNHNLQYVGNCIAVVPTEKEIKNGIFCDKFGNSR